MARLAAAFNTMAEQVATSHAELQQRLAESRTLMEDLSAAHRRAEAARAQAEAADRAKSDFLATMSHEIRTPINAVLGFCQVLELEDLSEERRREYLQRAQRAARQLASLVDDVLDLSKIQSGVMAIDPSPTPVRPAIDAVCIMLSESTRRKALAVTVDVEQDTVVHADPQLLQQILLNLMSNAVKFTPDGGRIAIGARVRCDNGTAPAVHVNVEDSGIGVPADQLERIFEPFVQADSSYTREFGGTGLGLAISRRLARLMGGDVVAASSEGAGSRFTLLLPSATVHSGS
jgi:signal transduction histidine kinase